MKGKKYIGQLISIKFTDRKTPIYGLVVDYNDDWTLLMHNPVDYVIDGYIIIRHKNIEGFRRDEIEKFKEKVIKLKGITPSIIPLTSLSVILNYLTQKAGIFQLETRSEKACYLGKLKSLNDKEVVINFLNTEGKWDGQMKFRPSDIRTIEFDTDYINSLKLLIPKK